MTLHDITCYRWGLTIDITSMNVLIISVGLCVDFCAHIVHGFLTGHGTKEEKVLYMMENIAPAVLNGGFSTPLAMSLLVTAKSHVATSFFKIFFMICIFGLFHGLILLPTVLCMVGPSDEDILRQNSKKRKHQHREIGDQDPSLNNGTTSDLKEREQNFENEQSELKVPLNKEESEPSSEAVISGEDLSRLKESPIV